MSNASLSATTEDLVKILANPEQKPAAKTPARPDPEEEDSEEEVEADEDEAADDEPDDEPSDETETVEGDEDEADGDDEEDAEGTDEADAPEADEADDDEDSDEDPAASSRIRLTPEEKKKFSAVYDRALTKKTRRIMELRKETERLQKALSESETPVAAPAASSDDPFADVMDEAALDKRLNEWKSLKRWARANREGGKIGDQEISAERAAQILDDAEDAIVEFGPKRRELLRQRAAGEAEAIAAIPALKDKTSAVSVAVNSLLRRFGNVRLGDVPRIRLLLADSISGETARKTPPADKTKKTAPKAPPAPAGGARAPKVATATKAATGARKKFNETGDDPNNAVLRSLIE